MVHDFAAMCRTLKPTSRTILIDMGASLDFHSKKIQPAVYLIRLFQAFGFSFDHIYAYEMSPKNPSHVFQSVPSSLKAAYHWINVGVDPDPHSDLNPWKMLLDHYTPDDFIVVKLDIDTPHVELPLVYQLMDNPKVAPLIDAFYFEHHVHLWELSPYWRSEVAGSILGSLKLFYWLRAKGIPAHYWV